MIERGSFFLRKSRYNIYQYFIQEGLIIMEDQRREQLEALETLVEYNERVMKNIPILVKELSGQRLEDTDKFLTDVINAINWEVEIVNLTMDVLNEGKVRVAKEEMNEKIIALANALKAKDDAAMAQAFEGLLPVLASLGEAAKEVLA